MNKLYYAKLKDYLPIHCRMYHGKEQLFLKTDCELKSRFMLQPFWTLESKQVMILAG